MKELGFEQRVYFGVEKDVPLREVAESLLALERLIRRCGPTLELIYPGTSVADIRVYLPELKTGSIWEKIFITMVFGGQEEFDKMLRDLKRDPVEFIKKNRAMAQIIVALILSGGMVLAAKNLASDESRANIQNSYNTIINNGSIELKVTPEEFGNAIDASLKGGNRVRNANDALKIIRPAKQEKAAEIRLYSAAENLEPVSIAPETVRAFPSGEVDEEESFEDYQQTEVDCRIINRDKLSGWKASLPKVLGDLRIPIKLPPDENPERLYTHPHFVADVTVLFQVADNGERQPRRILVHRIHQTLKR